MRSTIEKICQNPKCDNYLQRSCFAKRCQESCRDRRCLMYGRDHFAQMCRLGCDIRNCKKFGQYHPPGEPCSFGDKHDNYHQEYSPPPLNEEDRQAESDLYRQMLSTMGQSYQTQSMLLGQMGTNKIQHSTRQAHSQPQQQPFNPFGDSPFASFAPAMYGNNMSNLPFFGGHPFGQN